MVRSWSLLEMVRGLCPQSVEVCWARVTFNVPTGQQEPADENCCSLQEEDNVLTSNADHQTYSVIQLPSGSDTKPNCHCPHEKTTEQVTSGIVRGGTD